MHHIIHASVLFLLMSLGNLVAAGAEAVTKTTSTAEKKSKLIESGDDSFTYRCEGIGGYSVLFEGAHGRSWINLVYDSEQTNLMDPILNAVGANWGNKADDTLVWRGTMHGDRFVPYACIIKMAGSTDEGSSVETFVILQLAGAGSRVVGDSPGAKGLKAAMELADRLCKFE